MVAVTVIGCGPAGLAAAHAAAGLGADVRIIGPKVMTPQRGPILLQRPLPGISTDHPKAYIKQVVIGGSILDYRLKLYGDVNIGINGDILEDGYHAWPIPPAYDRLWYLYSDFIEDREVKPAEVDRLCDSADLVVSTAPAPVLCLNPDPHVYNQELRAFGHEFRAVEIAIVADTSYPDQPDNTIIFNARPEVPWVRSSSVFGNKVTEYRPEDCPAPDRIISKPLSTTCNCHPRVLRTGRFGRWHNETWIDTAYYDTRTAVYSILYRREWDGIK